MVILLMRFLLQRLVLNSFLVRLRYFFLIFFLSSSLIVNMAIFFDYTNIGEMSNEIIVIVIRFYD